MKRFNLLLLVTSSLVWSVAAVAATRPHYGGALRITVRQAPQTIQPAELVQAGAFNVSRLIFDTLVVLDDRGRPQPSLATSWQAEPGNQRWRFSLRSGVSFSDGTRLNATAVAASLRGSNPEWKVLASGETVVIETARPNLDLPAELALARSAVALGGQQLLRQSRPVVGLVLLVTQDDDPALVAALAQPVGRAQARRGRADDDHVL